MSSIRQVNFRIIKTVFFESKKKYPVTIDFNTADTQEKVDLEFKTRSN